jgi:phosphoethanolamine N-methyltransferase
MTDEEILYDQLHIDFLEDIWGDGFLSPGGADEVGRVLQGVDLAGRHVLDIGSGSGACAVLMARDHGAAHVTGIDVEDPVCDAARRRAELDGVADKVTIRKVSPGPFPFPDGTFDVVFSKDSIIHIPDKAAMAADAFRVLKPGGQFAASDWLISHDDEPSDQMKDYIKAEDLDFAMSSPATYARAMEAAGFVDVELVNRNPWYREEAARELAWLTGDERARLEGRYGADFIAAQINTWTRLVGVLQSGEHCPHHIRARKPA